MHLKVKVIEIFAYATKKDTIVSIIILASMEGFYFIANLLNFLFYNLQLLEHINW